MRNHVRRLHRVRWLVLIMIGFMMWLTPKPLLAYPYGQNIYGQGVYGQLGTPAPTATPTAVPTAAPTASSSSSTTVQPTARPSTRTIPGTTTSPIEPVVSPIPSPTTTEGSTNNQTPSWLQNLKNSSSPEAVTPPPIQTGWSQKLKIMIGLMLVVLGLIFLFWLIRRKPKTYYDQEQ